MIVLNLWLHCNSSIFTNHLQYFSQSLAIAWYSLTLAQVLIWMGTRRMAGRLECGVETGAGTRPRTDIEDRVEKFTGWVKTISNNAQRPCTSRSGDIVPFHWRVCYGAIPLRSTPARAECRTCVAYRTPIWDALLELFNYIYQITCSDRHDENLNTFQNGI